MISYFKMKKKEIELKLLIYGYVLEMIKEKDTVLEYLARFAHEQAVRERKTESVRQ